MPGQAYHLTSLCQLKIKLPVTIFRPEQKLFYKSKIKVSHNEKFCKKYLFGN
jgi:hypothetical protein